MLSKSKLTQLHKNGYLFPIDVLKPSEVARSKKKLNELFLALGGRPSPENLKQTHLYHSWAHSLVTDNRILDIVESVLGPNLLVHSTSIFCKYPKTDGFIPWHQDGVYWGLSKPDLWTVWLALSDSTRENGCMRVVPETHKQKFKHFEQKNDRVQLGSGLTIVEDISEDKIVNLELKAGQISLHHVNIAHSSQSNKSNSPRIGFAMRFINTKIRQTLPHFDVVLARGQDNYGHYSILKSPPNDDLTTSLKLEEAARGKYLKDRTIFLNSKS